MQAVMADGGEEETVPPRRIGAHVGVGKGRNGGAQRGGGKDGRLVEIEQGDDAERNQEQLYRIADIALGRVQLGDVVMRRVGGPEQRIVVHQPMHPILPEFEQSHDHEGLHEKWQRFQPW